MTIKKAGNVIYIIAVVVTILAIAVGIWLFTLDISWQFISVFWLLLCSAVVAMIAMTLWGAKDTWY